METAARKLVKDGISVSYEKWPIVILKIHQSVRLEDIDQTYEGLRGLVESGTKHIQWTDLLEVNPLTTNAQARRRFAEWEKRLRPFAEKCVAAEVRVLDNSIVRGIVRAFDWISVPPPWPLATVANDDQAYAWLEKVGALREVEGSVRPF